MSGGAEAAGAACRAALTPGHIIIAIAVTHTTRAIHRSRDFIAFLLPPDSPGSIPSSPDGSHAHPARRGRFSLSRAPPHGTGRLDPSGVGQHRTPSARPLLSVNGPGPQPTSRRREELGAPHRSRRPGSPVRLKG